MNATNVFDNAKKWVSATPPAAADQAATTPSGASADDLVTDSAATFTVDRVRKRDFDPITRDIQSLVKTKPEVALTGAVILGFIAGRLFSSR
jgi:hypothetical protein